MNIVECTHTNLDGIAYYTPILYSLFLGYKPVQHVTVQNYLETYETLAGVT